jgi:uncharacterized protein YcbK (DUF882 family)
MKLSKNFEDKEFVCPCCGKSDVSFALVRKLQELRDEISQPIYITSGFRCEKYNKKIGGYIDSPHIKGLAADIYCKNYDYKHLARSAKVVGFSRIGLYPNSYDKFIHVDIIPVYLSASWCRDKKGQYHYFKTLEETIDFVNNNFEKK